MSGSSARKIEANRRNARKSTGPRTAQGKKNARGNAYRHGLAVPFMPTRDELEQIESLAREIAGDQVDPMSLDHARSVAHAELDLARVRRTKVALIEHVAVFGELGPADQGFAIVKMLLAVLRRPSKMPDFEPPRKPPPMPMTEPERTAEAIRRLLPELQRLGRYESRAQRRRALALKLLVRPTIP